MDHEEYEPESSDMKSFTLPHNPGENLDISTFMKRRKKKLYTKGKAISVPKKPLTAYAIFVKKMRKDYQEMLKSGEIADVELDQFGNGMLLFCFIL